MRSKGLLVKKTGLKFRQVMVTIKKILEKPFKSDWNLESQNAKEKRKGERRNNFKSEINSKSTQGLPYNHEMYRETSYKMWDK